MLKAFNLLILLCVFTTGVAQIKNFRLEDYSSLKEPLEVSVAVNPRNTKNIVAASGQGKVYVTFDGGANWQKQSLSSSLGVGPNPVVLFDGKGELYYFHLSGQEKKFDRLICQVSKDGGKSWDDGHGFGWLPPKNQAGLWASVDEKENVYATWTQFDELGSVNENCTSTVMMSKSSNGHKWSSPVVISQTPGNCSLGSGAAAGAAPTVGADGKIMISWSNQNSIYLDRSYDGNFFLTNDITVTRKRDKNANTGLNQTGGRASVVLDRSKMVTRNNLYLAWQDKLSGNNGVGVFVLKSANFGDIVTAPERVYPDEGIDADQFLPSLAVDHSTGIVYILYYSKVPDTGVTDVYVAYSVNGGHTFKSVKINESSFQFDPSVIVPYVHLSAAKGVISPVWVSTDNGTATVWSSVISQETLLNAPETTKKN